MMSLLRIVFGVLVGIGILAGLVFVGWRFPAFAHRTAGLLFVPPGCFMAWLISRSLRLGVITVKGSRYERHVRPFVFWFYVFFFSFVTITILVIGLGSTLLR